MVRKDGFTARLSTCLYRRRHPESSIGAFCGIDHPHPAVPQGFGSLPCAKAWDLLGRSRRSLYSQHFPMAIEQGTAVARPCQSS